jgi:alpha-N-arabinofuranosidase
LRDSPAYESTEFGAVPLVDALATRDGVKIAVFALNRGQQSAILETAFEGGRWKVEAHEELIVDDPAAANTVAHPDAVKPRKNTLTRVDAGTLSLKLSPLSWHCVRLKAA